MRTEFLVSLTFHAALLAALTLTVARQTPLALPPSEAIAVELVTVAPVSRTLTPAQPSRPVAPRQSQPVEPVPTEPPPEKIAQKPLAESPLPDRSPRLALKPPPPTPPVAEAAPARPQQRLDSARLANLIDRRVPEAERKPLNTAALAQKLEADIAQSAQLDRHAAATLQQAMDAQVSRCFNPPSGGVDVLSMTVVLRLRLDPEGRVVSGPEVIEKTGVPRGAEAYGEALTQAARRAVLMCAPYRLPGELAPLWAGQALELRFDPSRLL